MSLIAMRTWARDNSFIGDIAYFFEAGHEKAPEANKIMTRIFSIPLLKEQYRYAEHAFLLKESHGALQSADMFAWHHVKNYDDLSTDKSLEKILLR